MTLAYYGKSPKRRIALGLGALLAVLIAMAGALALRSALAGTPTSGDKSNIMGATFTSGGAPTISQDSQMFCNGDTASSFSSSVTFTLSAPSPAGGYFIFYLDPNGGSDADPTVVHQNESAQVPIGGLSAGLHTVSFTVPITHPFTTTKGGILIVFSDDVSGTGWNSKSNSLNCTEATTQPDVSVAKTDSTSHSVAAGGSFNWVITTTVSGATTTASASITDTIPSGMTAGTYVLSTTGTVGKLSCSPTSGNNVSCTLASGAAAGTYTVTIPITAPAASSLANCKLYANTANVTGGGGTNNTASSEDDVTVTGCAAPTVNVVKSDNVNGTVAAGGSFNWIITATVANGPTTQSVHITDSAPAGMAFGNITLSGTGTSGKLTCTASSGSPVDCTIASGAGNGTYIITIAVTAPAANNTDNCHDYINTATSQVGTLPATNPSDTVAVTGCANPTVTVVKTDDVNHSVAAGGTFNWIITATVANGPTTQSVHITDSAPSGMTFGSITKGGTGNAASLTCTASSGSPVDCTIAAGATNGTYTVTIAVTAPAANNTANCHDYTNTASSQVGTQPATNPSDTVTVTTCANPTISILKTDDVNHSVAAGGSFNYTITVTVSNGPTTTAYSVNDSAPTGITFGAITKSGTGDLTKFTGNASGSPVGWTLAVGATNGTYVLSVAATAPAATPATNCTDYINTASIPIVGAAPITSSDTVTVTGCTRTVQVIKRMADGSANAATFDYTVTNDPNSPHTGLGVSTSGSWSVDVLQESSSQEHVVTETPKTGFVLDGYYVIQDSGDGAPGRCFPNPPSGLPALTATATIPADGLPYLVCMVNHPAAGRLIIEKDNIGGDPADTFTADISGGEQNISFSENTPATRSLSPGSVTVHEDPQAGYTYIGYTAGHCLASGQVADLVVREDAVAQLGDFTGTIVDGQDTVVCFHNQKMRHITIIKNVDNAGQICDATLFPIVEDSQTANSQTVGDISDCNVTIGIDVDTNGHTFTESPMPSGYTFVDAFESDANCTPTPGEVPGTAVGNTYVLDPGAEDEIICFVNHKPQGTLIIKKVNEGGPQTDIFTADIAGGDQDIQFSASGLGPASRTLVPGQYSVSEDPLTGYTYLGFALGNSDHICPLAPTSNGAAPTTNDVTIADNGTTTICFYNQAVGHIQVNKIDQTNGVAPQPASWLFDVTGPVNDLNHSIALGGGSYTLDVPLGTYTATETNGDFSACPTVNESGAWRSQALTATTQTLDTPGETIVFTFQNAACNIVLGTGNLVIEKYSDFNADHAINGSDALLNGWAVTVVGPQFPSPGQTFVTGANGNPFGTIVLSGITDGAYTVTETNQAGFTVVGVVNVNTNTFTAGTSGSGSVADGVTTTIRFFNQPKVNIHVTKTEVTGAGANPGSGWTVTLTGCGVNQPLVTNASGVADFTNLNLCANYVVTETTNSKPNFVPAGPASVQVAATTAGNTYNVNFTNTLLQTCTSNCTPPPSPSPSPSPTATPTNTPTATPTARPTNTPTATPTNTPISNVEGARTPGPGTTPIAPSTGSGIFGGRSSSMNVLLALAGLVALATGMATLGFVRRKAK